MVCLSIEKLNNFLPKRKHTLLGIGPMSKNCTDACIELANENNVPLMLIASRRQIDSNESGGGYVNNWTTEKFSSYVKSHDNNKNIIINIIPSRNSSVISSSSYAKTCRISFICA